MSQHTSTDQTYQPPPARILRKTLSVTYAGYLPRPSWHIDPLCEGLEKVKRERLHTREFADAWALGADTDGRICRMCTLESLLLTILRNTGEQARRHVTFSSRPPVKGGARGDPWRTIYGATPSGEARLRRLAKTLGLETVATPSSGVVAYGEVPVRALDTLGANLDTLTLSWVRQTPGSEHIQCFWVLVDDQTRPLNRARRRDLWTAARLLTS